MNSNKVSFKLLKDNMELDSRRHAVKEGEDKEQRQKLDCLTWERFAEPQLYGLSNGIRRGCRWGSDGGTFSREMAEVHTH